VRGILYLFVLAFAAFFVGSFVFGLLHIVASSCAAAG
jgi:hypothetical protein